jgi:multiple sugar transport system permease protein
VQAAKRIGYQDKGSPRTAWTEGSLFGVVLIAPLMLWLVVTIAIPLVYAVYQSFTSIGIIGTQATFVGLDNYARVLREPDFGSAFVRSIIWTFGGALLQTVLAFIAALSLNQAFYGQRFARIWIILSWIIPTIVIAIIWRWMLNPAFGIINFSLVTLGIADGPIDFLGSPTWALPTVIAINAWRLFPFLALIILAGLQGISHEYYEAAQVDGAGPVKRFFTITLPLLQPVLYVVGLIGTLWAFNVFDVIWLLTQGGPVGTTRTLPVLVYERAFQGFALGQASTIAVLLSVFLLLFSILYIRFVPGGETEGEVI